MATYTIHQQPDDYSPAYNDLIFVVKSSNYTSTNFSYLATLYIGSDTFTIKAPAHPTYGSGVFNFGRIIENYVNSDIGDTLYGFNRNSNSYISYYIKFGEEYGSTITQYTNITTTNVKYVWNGVLDFLQFQNYSRNNYSADGNKLLSNSITRKIEYTNDAWLYFFSKDTGSYNKAIINAYNSSNTLIRGVEITNFYTSSGTIGNHFLRFSSGPHNINLITSGITNTYSTGTIIPSTTDHYTIQFDGGSASDTITFNVVESDCRYDTYRLHFLNALGAFESFNFIKVSRTKTDITKNSYKAPIGGLTSATAWGYNKSDRSDRQFFITSKDTLTLKSDWLTEAESTWLLELVESPEVYLDDATNGLISVTVQNSSYESKKTVNDKLFQLELEIKFSYNRYRQRY